MVWKYCLLILLTGLTSCHPEAFSKQKYTSFRSGHSAKYYYKFKTPSSENNDAFIEKDIIKTSDDTLAPAEVNLPATPKAEEITVNAEKENRTVTFTNKVSGIISKPLNSGLINLNKISFRKIGAAAKKQKQKAGRSSVYEIVGMIFLWLLALGVLVSLFTLLFFGNPSLGLFFVFLGIFLLFAVIFGISMLGCRASPVNGYE